MTKAYLDSRDLLAFRSHAAPKVTEADIDGADATYRKVMWRILPMLVICYVVAFIDRSNVGFAKLQFMRDLGFSETVYGIGGGIFYLGYLLLEIPSNLYLAVAGVRKTLLRIMVLWGGCCALLAFMDSPVHYYLLRFLLGAVEAGLFPGILLYLTYWVPAPRRARFTALFTASIPVAGVIGGPLAGWIMEAMAGAWGLKGWQWLFLLEGLPACLIGVFAYYYLDNGPRECKWLSAGQQTLLLRDLERDRVTRGCRGDQSFGQALRDPTIYLLIGLGFAINVSTSGIFLWLPTIVHRSGVRSGRNIGLLSSIPFVVGLAAQFWVARNSDRTIERRWHAALPALIAAAGWAVLPLVSNNTPLSLFMLTLVTAGTLATMGPYWTLPATLLSSTAAAGGIAFITAVAAFGNFVSPILVGWLATKTGSLAIGLYYFSGLLVLGAVALLMGIQATSSRPTGA